MRGGRSCVNIDSYIRPNEIGNKSGMDETEHKPQANLTLNAALESSYVISQLNDVESNFKHEKHMELPIDGDEMTGSEYKMKTVPHEKQPELAESIVEQKRDAKEKFIDRPKYNTTTPFAPMAPPTNFGYPTIVPMESTYYGSIPNLPNAFIAHPVLYQQIKRPSAAYAYTGNADMQPTIDEVVAPIKEESNEDVRDEDEKGSEYAFEYEENPESDVRGPEIGEPKVENEEIDGQNTPESPMDYSRPMAVSEYNMTDLHDWAFV
ncbi:hypothetical protein AB6A40_005220 [Gnathostoma spinigerum]|uniref:Uncharacterized protein n=1 Tax=Gnathostoma spinigerum TaxID=75299 RepID=A0ABD6EH21_9BILA